MDGDDVGRGWLSSPVFKIEPETPPGSSRYRPRVCLQVPAYNEPPELVRQDLEALARLDYPDYLVQVVANNTTDPVLWRPVEDACAELG